MRIREFRRWAVALLAGTMLMGSVSGSAIAEDNTNIEEAAHQQAESEAASEAARQKAESEAASEAARQQAESEAASEEAAAQEKGAKEADKKDAEQSGKKKEEKAAETGKAGEEKATEAPVQEETPAAEVKEEKTEEKPAAQAPEKTEEAPKAEAAANKDDQEEKADTAGQEVKEETMAAEAAAQIEEQGLETLPEEETETDENGEKAETEKKVTIFSSQWVVIRPGETIYLTSRLEGFEDCEDIVYQWMCNKGEGFEEVEGANEAAYSFVADKETLTWGWRLMVYFK